MRTTKNARLIVAARRALGMSQKQLAARTRETGESVSLSTVASAEQTGHLTARTARVLASVLGVAPEDLVRR